KVGDSGADQPDRDLSLRYLQSQPISLPPSLPTYARSHVPETLSLWSPNLYHEQADFPISNDLLETVEAVLVEDGKVVASFLRCYHAILLRVHRVEVDLSFLEQYSETIVSLYAHAKFDRQPLSKGPTHPDACPNASGSRTKPAILQDARRSTIQRSCLGQERAYRCCTEPGDPSHRRSPHS
ncbi:hypothetical protein DOTSEDRAFT_70700, partial [Dothistroma septosporum NZE10]